MSAYDSDKGRFQAPADFDGPIAHRGCTDVIFAGLMLVCWIAMTGIGIYSFQRGDHRVVLYPMDYDGNICGTDYGENNMTAYPRLVYINNLGGGVCVEECPNVTELVDARTLITYNGVYQEDGAFLPEDFVSMPDYSTASNVATCNESLCSTDPAISWTRAGINKGKGFAYYALDTYEILGVRCLSNPKATEKLKDIIQTDIPIIDSDQWTGTTEFFGNLYGDLFVARWYILAFGIAAAMLIGFVYAQLLRFQPLLGLMIWGSILASIVIIFGMGGYSYTLVQDWEAEDPRVRSDFDIRATKYFSYFLFALGGLVFFLTIFLRKQIQLAMACVREAARAIGCMPLIVAFPVIQSIGFLAFILVWIFFAVHLASTGDIKEIDLPTTVKVTMRQYEFDDTTTYLGWYLIFCLFWTIAFIQALGQIVISMCVAKWYFTRDKWTVGSATVFKSIYDSLRYHLGTAAFGSFIIAVTKIVRMIVAKAQQKARELGNALGEALLCCCQCCLWCFEQFIKFLNKNAYIQCAIFGTPFCRSAREAFGLITRNVGKVGSISYVSTIVLFVGKFFISCLTTAGAYIYINQEMGEQLYSLMGPCGLIFIMSYFVGDMFLDVFDMSTSTVLHCFVADEEMFDGDECYAEGKLRDWLDDFEKSERQIVAGK